MTIQAVILTGGSEIVAVSVAEQLVNAGIGFGIIVLGASTLLGKAVPKTDVCRLSWPPDSPERAARDMRDQLARWGASSQSPLVLFPTEDGGLRLCLEYMVLLQDLALFSRARALPMLGGLDKAELFDYLQSTSCRQWVAPTRTIQAVEELASIQREWGKDLVIKPALKPLSMDLRGMPAKAFLARDHAEPDALVTALRGAWTVSSQWVVQPRLHTGTSGETVIWAARSAAGDVQMIQAIERWKIPRQNGTGCWVETTELNSELASIAGNVLHGLDFVGVCELEFLYDEIGNYRLLEINPRPWLQIGLPATSGLPMVHRAYLALHNEPLPEGHTAIGVGWVNLERLAEAVIRREYAGWSRGLSIAIGAACSAKEWAVWSTRLPGVRLRWLGRMAIKLMHVLRRTRREKSPNTCPNP